ncbi:MAG: hypothetical protein PHU85_20705, partial [Phycisphaerae bacterium]|nr:hypothetical protein [Phycisphaerae bacterium]
MSQMPAQPFAAAVPVAVPTAPEMLLPQYRIRRKVFKLFGGKFTFYDLAGNEVMVSKQKAFKLKEDIRIYSASRPDVELLTIKARAVIDFAAAYDVFDTQQNV